MSVTPSPSQDRLFGVALVCKAWKIPRSTYYDARERRMKGTQPSKPGPKPALDDQELAVEIRAIHRRVEDEFGLRGEGYRKAHARLRHAGRRASKDRVLRVMREHGLLAATPVGTPRGLSLIHI